MLREVVLNIVAKYKPTKSLLHNIAYLEAGQYSVDWKITVTGVYSESLQEAVDKLIEEGAVKICPNGRLTLDACPEDLGDYSSVVLEAVKAYVSSNAPSRGHPGGMETYDIRRASD
ncbi:MAG: hypothetical protein ABWK00_00585 [Desulfurococcaceae archaeon]